MCYWLFIYFILGFEFCFLNRETSRCDLRFSLIGT
jgi:hypothetical protein